MKLIKRKNIAHTNNIVESQFLNNNTNNYNNNDNNNIKNNAKEESMIEYCNKELNTNRISKLKLAKLLTLLMKHLQLTNERQKDLEYKVESLGKQNEEFMIQNNQILQEIVNKR